MVFSPAGLLRAPQPPLPFTPSPFQRPRRLLQRCSQSPPCNFPFNSHSLPSPSHLQRPCRRLHRGRRPTSAAVELGNLKTIQKFIFLVLSQPFFLSHDVFLCLFCSPPLCPPPLRSSARSSPLRRDSSLTPSARFQPPPAARSTALAFAVVPEYPKRVGHDIAFAMATFTSLPNTLPSQYLVLLNDKSIGNSSDHLFDVQFDTVQDFEFGDIIDNHVGVNLNNLASNKYVPARYSMYGLTHPRSNLAIGFSITL